MQFADLDTWTLLPKQLAFALPRYHGTQSCRTHTPKVELISVLSCSGGLAEMSLKWSLHPKLCVLLAASALCQMGKKMRVTAGMWGKFQQFGVVSYYIH